MQTDPGISTTNPHSPTTYVDKYGKTHRKKPTGPRWLGRKAPDGRAQPPGGYSQATKQALADIRRWERALALGLLTGFWTEADVDRALYKRELHADRGVAVEILDAVARELGERAWRLLEMVATVLVVFRARGVIATWEQLGRFLGVHKNTARADMAILLDLELVTLVTPTFEPIRCKKAQQGVRGCACGLCTAKHPPKSRRGGAFTLGPAVHRVLLRGIACARASLTTDSSSDIHKNCEASGTEHTYAFLRRSDSASGEPERALQGYQSPEPASPDAVAASPGIDFRVPDASDRAVGPARREGETCDAPGEAHQGEGRDEIRELLAERFGRGGDA